MVGLIENIAFLPATNQQSVDWFPSEQKSPLSMGFRSPRQSEFHVTYG